VILDAYRGTSLTRKHTPQTLPYAYAQGPRGVLGAATDAPRNRFSISIFIQIKMLSLSSEHGTYKAVKARPWLSGNSP